MICVWLCGCGCVGVGVSVVVWAACAVYLVTCPRLLSAPSTALSAQRHPFSSGGTAASEEVSQ